MSTFHPHTGATPESNAAAGRRPWHARPDADDFPFTVRELRNHLDRLGYRARSGQVGGEDVREMQARVAALRESLQDEGHRQGRNEDFGEANHAARTKFYERRIRAALADMATQLNDESLPGHSPSGLDVASRAWLDQRFAALRNSLENALSQVSPYQAEHDFTSALEQTRERLNAMEAKLDASVARQQDANSRIIQLIDARARTSHSPTQDDELLKSLDARLQTLQQGFDRAMDELDAMKTGTQRLAIRASATVARQTARATAQHVAKAVREAAPERRFARLEDSVTGCVDETRSLRQQTGEIQQTLEDGLEDLRDRINELTLSTRKAAGPAPETGTSHAQPRPAHTGAAAIHPRTAAQTDQSGAASGTRPAGGLISRLGFAAVILLLLAASFAMLYAQLSGGDWQLPAIGARDLSPASTSKADRLDPAPVYAPDADGRVILPGIILTNGAPQQV